MGLELKNEHGSYRIVYFQPDPEDGERVAVALLVDTKGRSHLLADQTFPKVKCLAPRFDATLLSYYLREMELRLSNSNFDGVLKWLGPQFSASPDRILAAPFSERITLQLIQRFLSKPKESLRVIEKPVLDPVVDRISRYVRNLMPPKSPNVLTNVRPVDIFGVDTKRSIKPVAVAIRTERATVLVDGVDLRLLTAREAVDRTNDVTHNFWQYNRIEKLFAFPKYRVGLVLNGVQTASTDYQDAHDYAVHQFTKESDLMVDAASIDAQRELESVLAEISQ